MRTVIPAYEAAGESAMMGRQDRDQRQLFYEFSLDEAIPRDHLLRRINVFMTAVLADLHEQLYFWFWPWLNPDGDLSGISRLGPDLARNIEAYPAYLPILWNLQEGRV